MRPAFSYLPGITFANTASALLSNPETGSFKHKTMKCNYQ